MTTDNGPPFNAHEFEKFAQAYGFEHITGSPGYPQSNRKAENAVKLAKSTLKKAHHSGQDGYLALLELRNTPSEILNSSPALRLFARRTRTQVLIARSLLKPSVVQTGPGLQEGKRKQTRYYNRGATELAELKSGQIVRFRPPGSRTWVKAQVNKQADIDLTVFAPKMDANTEEIDGQSEKQMRISFSQ